MSAPFDVGVVDLMVALPTGGDTWRDELAPLLKDPGSASFAHPASYMYRNLPAARTAVDPVGAVLDEMDRFGVERALVGVDPSDDAAVRAVRAHPDRFVPSVDVDPTAGVAGVRALRSAVEDLGARAAAAFTAGSFPPVGRATIRSTTPTSKLLTRTAPAPVRVLEGGAGRRAPG